jgi:hypothetical protein
MRSLAVLVALVACVLGPGSAGAGHDNLEVDPALKRYAGQVVALGEPDAQGRVYSFQAKRLPTAPAFAQDELRGWRLTMLAGKRFAQAFEVLSNTASEITVSALDGPLEGVAVSDVFVVENIAIERQKPAQ